MQHKVPSEPGSFHHAVTPLVEVLRPYQEHFVENF